ncbi:hypothetical protein ATK74_0738 [Propionicimonas paludicola]|uniref:Uncharacterized protein n=1 Tax=Propionicimonas paludicola TaxID=185243 RepID=A0A2A9CPX8_9ACTN|nr:hypothetical protein ATK74_0738 [Propionicimonas paludicola]
MFGFGVRSQRGVTTVEYLVIVAGISMIAVLGAGRVGLGVSSNLCEAGKSLGSSAQCVKPAAVPSASPTSTPVDIGGGTGGSGTGGSGSGGSSEPTATSTSSSGTGGGAGGGTGGAAATPTPTPTNSPGSMTYNTAVIDQDAILSDLSVRFNLGWFPSDWNQVSYPTTMTMDVTWSPALAVDKVIAGSDGTWTYTLIEPGKMRLTRTGSFDTSGFQPEPEILLVKPATRQSVQVSFSASAPNSPTLTRTASTTSIPY